MKKGYQSVQMRVWRYSEDIVRTSNVMERAWTDGAGDSNPLENTNTFSQN